MHEGFLFECLLGYENITNIFLAVILKSHKFDSCIFNTRSTALKVEKLQELS